MKSNQQYYILKVDVADILKNNFDLQFNQDEELLHLVAEQNSHLIYIIENLRGKFSDKIEEVIFVVARHDKKKWEKYSELFRNGFIYNGKRYLRFGKSASQAKDGVTVFVVDSMYHKLMKISMLDIDVDNKDVVISKYEAQRCLIFSSCTLLNIKIPNIVIVDEYEKVLKNQDIKYSEDVDKNGYIRHEITEGKVDVRLSPFDGFGVHRRFIGEQCATDIGLDYVPAAIQVRLPFTKGLSVEFDFEDYYKSMGVSEITDVCGNKHNIKDVDCIWNTSMFKAFGLFKEKYGKSAISEYFSILEKYDFKLGVSKYSHHTDDINFMTRLNFQYLQCLDLQNKKYLNHYNSLKLNLNDEYNLLDDSNDGKIIKMAKYSTDLFYKIVGGELFHCLKFLGVSNSEDDMCGNYIKAILINKDMLNDPSIKRFLLRKAKKYINEFKLGKIYCDGFYHLVCGDIIAYLEYCAGISPVGVLKEDEFFVSTIFSNENVAAFRSPLVCQSEVKIARALNCVAGYEKYFEHFKNQNLVMINEYDLTMPQMGGMDQDGDIVFLTNNQIILDSKIEKKIVVSVNDKAVAKKLAYNMDNIIDYELRSRDSRIGEITNIATSILNRYTENQKYKKMNDDNVSFLRLLQGIEIDSIKTGVRWRIPNYLRDYLRQIPYFLLFNYPKKMSAYIKTDKKNKVSPESKKRLNAYHSCSPMNELCSYICEWEKKKILWNKSMVNTGVLLVDNSLNYSDTELIKKMRVLNDRFSKEWKSCVKDFYKDISLGSNLNLLIEKYRKELLSLGADRIWLANYFIKTSYMSYSTNKILCWSVFADEMLFNLRKNSPPEKSTKIEKINEKCDNSFEFLGKYYTMCGD